MNEYDAWYDTDATYWRNDGSYGGKGFGRQLE